MKRAMITATTAVSNHSRRASQPSLSSFSLSLSVSLLPSSGAIFSGLGGRRSRMPRLRISRMRTEHQARPDRKDSNLIPVRPQDGQEGLLGDFHPAHGLHALLALLLLLPELALAGDVPPVTLGRDVLGHGRDGLTGQDAL